MVAFVKHPDSRLLGINPLSTGERTVGLGGAPVGRRAAFDSLLQQARGAGLEAAPGPLQDPGALARTLMERMQVRAADRLLRLLSGSEAGEVREQDGKVLEQLLEMAARAAREAEPEASPEVSPDRSRTEVSRKGATPAGSVKMAEIIEDAARRYGVDPLLVRCVIRAESGFRPGSTSPRGAMGLMQLMPGTARDLGVRNAYDPEENVHAGTRYLKSLLDRYGGDLPRALAAYNWGMGNVDRRPGRLPEETRRYVAGILQEYQKTSA
jgi:soluble lytic murein transglycosylase-like protein